MRNAEKKSAGVLLALAFVASAAGAARAEIVCDGVKVNAAYCTVGEAVGAAKSAVSAVKTAIVERLKKEARKPAYKPCPEGTHPSQEGELGTVCRNDRPASVTCQIIGWKDSPEGDMGVVRRPILGECDPKGGWAGTGPTDPGPQAP